MAAHSHTASLLHVCWQAAVRIDLLSMDAIKAGLASHPQIAASSVIAFVPFHCGRSHLGDAIPAARIAQVVQGAPPCQSVPAHHGQVRVRSIVQHLIGPGNGQLGGHFLDLADWGAAPESSGSNAAVNGLPA